MKKLYILVLALTAFSIGAVAQYDPYVTQYRWTKLSYNPAYAGAENQACATLLYRNLWLGNNPDVIEGVDEPGAGQSQFLSFHFPLTLNEDFKLGLGLEIMNDVVGPMSALAPHFTGAIHYTGLDAGNISAGIGVGMFQRGIDGATLRALHPNDPLIPAGQESDMAPDFNFGLYFYRPNEYYAGFSSTHLLEQSFKWPTLAQAQMKRAYYLMGGYNFVNLLGNGIDLQPGFQFKYQGDWQVDINAIAMFDDTYWGGLNFRTRDAISLMGGMLINQNLKVGLAYDIGYVGNAIKRLGTPEVMVSYCFDLNLKTREREPNPIWTPRHL